MKVYVLVDEKILSSAIFKLLFGIRLLRVSATMEESRSTGSSLPRRVISSEEASERTSKPPTTEGMKSAMGSPRARRPNHEGVSQFELLLSRDSFKFSASHFVASEGHRERLHGHDYRVSVRLSGAHTIGSNGYVVDQRHIRDAIEKTCRELDERFLCPMLTRVLDVTIALDTCGQQSVTLVCQDGSSFSFPKSDCALLPIVHTTTEELAVFLWGRILENIQAEYLLKRDVHSMQVKVAEGVGQETTFQLQIPRKQDQSAQMFDVAEFIRGNEGGHIPVPFVIRESALMNGNGSIDCSESLSQASNVRERAEI